MRKAVLFSALFVLSAVISGCATTLSDVYTGGAREEKRSVVRYIAITSTPSDAEIYLNDRLVARTPYALVPLQCTYMVQKKPYGLGYGEPYGEVCDNVIIRGSKKGYKDAFETRFIKEEYHFNLEPEVSVQSHIESETPAVNSTAKADLSHSTIPLSQIKLDAIFVGNDRSQAIINSRVINIGDKITIYHQKDRYLHLN